MKAVSVDVIGLVLSCVTNLIVSSAGFRSIQSCDRDILMPFAIVIFLFYPMLISLPEAHYKFTNFGLSSQLSLSERAKEADEIYPYAFLFCLLSIALCAFADKYLINPNFTVEVYENERSKNTMKTNQLALSFLLTISITVQNMISFYFVCLEDNQTKTIKEIALFYCFNIIIYYAYGN